LSDLIIPADERSGSATQANVPEVIDDWLNVRGGSTATEIIGGMRWLDMPCNRLYGHDLIDCTVDQQHEILDRIAYPKKAALEDSQAVAFFNELRDLVVGSFYSSKSVSKTSVTSAIEWCRIGTAAQNQLSRS
jgi:gluconate 2-dehydrogenase gamma chain